MPSSLSLIFETRLLEVMTVPLPDVDGALEPAGADTVLERAERSTRSCSDLGWGGSPVPFELVRTLARRVSLPLLLDADGLNAHAGNLAVLAERDAPTVLTPHAGELARLLDTDSKTVEAHRLACARRAAAEAQAIVVLKGDDTLVAHPSGWVGASPGDPQPWPRPERAMFSPG